MKVRLQLRIEDMVERRVGIWRTSTIREFLHGPVRQSWLFVVQEDTAILYRWRAVRASASLDKEG